MTLILPDSPASRQRAANAVSEGGAIAFRTDTFYGLGADPFNAEALRALKRLKGRDETKPILVVVSDARMAERLVAARSNLFEALSASFWPGALTLVAPARTDVPTELTAGTGTVGVRLPDDERVRAIVRDCGGALTATSANLAGGEPGRTVEEVARSFREGLSLILDGGAVRALKPSTVIDVSDEHAARLIREGEVSRHELSRVLDSIGARLLADE